MSLVCKGGRPLNLSLARGSGGLWEGRWYGDGGSNPGVARQNRYFTALNGLLKNRSQNRTSSLRAIKWSQDWTNQTFDFLPQRTIKREGKKCSCTLLLMPVQLLYPRILATRVSKNSLWRNATVYRYACLANFMQMAVSDFGRKILLWTWEKSEFKMQIMVCWARHGIGGMSVIWNCLQIIDTCSFADHYHVYS